jgi:hypothetical protein
MSWAGARLTCRLDTTAARRMPVILALKQHATQLDARTLRARSLKAQVKRRQLEAKSSPTPSRTGLPWGVAR